MVDVIGVVLLLAVVKEGIFPLPIDCAKPIFVLLLVQLKVVPETELENAIVPEACPAQKEVSFIRTMIGVGFITMVLLTVVVPHSLVTLTEIL